MKEENRSQEPAVELSPTRRSFYIKFIYGVMSLIGVSLATPAAIYLFFPPKLRKEAEWVDATDLSKIPVGTPTEISFQRNRVDAWKVISEKATAWVVKGADGKVTAFSPTCTHLGCAYHWDAPTHNFVCPCHTSAFSIDGKVLAGPAPRPLDRFAVKVEGNKLQLGRIETNA